MAQMIPTLTCPAGPTLELFLTSECRGRCAYCYLGEKKEPEVMPPEVLDAAVERFGGGRDLVLVGGEPLLEPDLCRRAAAKFWALSQQMRLHVVASGEQPDPVASAGLCRELSMSVTVSLDGPEEVHDAQRGRGAHARVMKFLCALHNASVRVRLRGTVDPEPWADLLPWRRSLRELMLRGGVGGGGDLEIASGRKLTPPQLDILREDAAWYAEGRRRGRLPPVWRLADRLLAARPNPLPPFGPPCGAGFGIVGVAPDGTLHPCHRLGYCLGSADVGFNALDLAEYRNGIFRERFDVTRRGGCTACEHYHACRGGCPVSQAPRDVCDLTRAVASGIRGDVK